MARRKLVGPLFLSQTGVEYSNSTKAITAFLEGANIQLYYGHGDFTLANNSLGGKVNPDATVLLAASTACCPMAEMIDENDLNEWKAKYPQATVATQRPCPL